MPDRILADFNAFASELVSKRMFGLEVGPGLFPKFPKRDGYKVHVLDYTDRAGLQAKYANTEYDIETIEDVDYISDGRPIHEVVVAREEYDFISASHVIEHVTDVLGFFKSAELLLKPGGLVLLSVPDKRYCMDAFQSVSTTGEILMANRENTGRHSPARVFDFFSNYAQLDGLDTWSELDVRPVKLNNDVNEGKNFFNLSLTPGAPYIDIHAWRFVPSSFRLIVHDLQTLGETTLGEASFALSPVYEFYIALRKGAPSLPVERIDLTRASVREQAQGMLQLLAPFNSINHVLRFQS